MVDGIAQAATEQEPAQCGEGGGLARAALGGSGGDRAAGRAPGPAGAGLRRPRGSLSRPALRPARRSRSHSTSSPIAKRAPRRAQRSRRMALARGNCRPGRPPPMITGATLRCSRSSRPCADEARHRDAAALDEQDAQAARAQRRLHGGQVERRRRRSRGTPSTRSAPSRAAASCWRVTSHTSSVGAWPSVKTRALGRTRRAGSSTTRTGLGPATRRVVSCGSSSDAVPAPTITASHSARSRCRCTSTCGPLTKSASPPCVATRPSRLWPSWPMTQPGPSPGASSSGLSRSNSCDRRVVPGAGQAVARTRPARRSRQPGAPAGAPRRGAAGARRCRAIARHSGQRVFDAARRSGGGGGHAASASGSAGYQLGV